MLYIRFPLSLRNVEDLLHERGIYVSHETVRYWWNRFGPIFAAEIRRKRARHLQAWPQWRWHLDEMFIRINGEMALSRCWRLLQSHSEIRDFRQQRSAPSIAETLGLEILSWCGGT